jgi:hypothetical protein
MSRAGIVMAWKRGLSPLSRNWRACTLNAKRELLSQVRNPQTSVGTPKKPDQGALENKP